MQLIQPQHSLDAAMHPSHFEYMMITSMIHYVWPHQILIPKKKKKKTTSNKLLSQWKPHNEEMPKGRKRWKKWKGSNMSFRDILSSLSAQGIWWYPRRTWNSCLTELFFLLSFSISKYYNNFLRQSTCT